MNLDYEKKTIRRLSNRIVKAQKPIQLLNVIKWDESVRTEFFANNCEKLPAIDEEYYAKNCPLPFSPDEKIEEFNGIVADARKLLGEDSILTRLMTRRCNDYCRAMEMLKVRGTPGFSELSKELYGSADDRFYAGGPSLSDMSELLCDLLQQLFREMVSDSDIKQYSAREAKVILEERFTHFFSETDKVGIKINSKIVADAAAGAKHITLNRKVRFSDRDLKYLEVHEGWVHIGTSYNGAIQPYCTFLSKGSPACSVTQEGLAVITEIFTFSSYPSRMLKIANRVRAIDMVNKGADFIEVYRFFLQQGRSEQDSYSYASRVFRGSSPTLGPFTKDLSYSKGFILIYNFIRLAVQKNLVDYIPLFFIGKLLIEEVHEFYELMDMGLVVPPVYMPPQFKDLPALSAWMCFSLYLNKFELDKLEDIYKWILRE